MISFRYRDQRIIGIKYSLQNNFREFSGKVTLKKWIFIGFCSINQNQIFAIRNVLFAIKSKMMFSKNVNYEIILALKKGIFLIENVIQIFFGSNFNSIYGKFNPKIEIGHIPCRFDRNSRKWNPK